VSATRYCQVLTLLESTNQVGEPDQYSSLPMPSVGVETVMALFYLQTRKGTANITQDLHAMINRLYQNSHSIYRMGPDQQSEQSARENYEEK
jgi:hypothetical protein